MTVDPASWWRHGVVYQIYPRSYQDANGDGIGDLAGITGRLDHLEWLGIDAIWLSPFYPSPKADFGYDVADYCDVDPDYGTLGDFDRLIEAAHRRGIRLIVDIVPNHSSDEHPWFRASRSSRDDPKRDWYVWADPKPDGSPPNNWRSHFARVSGPAWTLDAATGQYYLHSFHPKQPDLNWWNPDVRDEFDRILRFWLDRGVDGFRIDVAHKLARDPELRDNTYDTAGVPVGRRYDEDWPEIHTILRRWRRILDEYDGRMAVGEVFLLDPARLVPYYGAEDDELHLAFNFSFLRQPWSAGAFRAATDAFDGLLPPSAWPDYTLSNHDNPRARSRYDGNGKGEARARLAALMLLTLRGTPFVYYGEEIGMPDGEIPPDRVVDVADRDPERTPMQWDRTASAGFTTGEPWLPVGSSATRINVEAEQGDPRSMLTLYRTLLAYRRASTALTRGTYSPVDAGDDVFAYWRASDGERLLVALNFSARPTSISVEPGTAPGAIELSTDPDRATQPVALGQIELGANEGLVLRCS
ncbi:MAG: alpha-amylase family glycosyl hydrolase [Chloroflexota bacterium]